MKKILLLFLLVQSFNQPMQAQSMSLAITKQKDGTYIINTTMIGENIQGYGGPTPVKISVKNEKIASVEVLDNDESPKYIRKVVQELLPKYKGLMVKDVMKKQPDGVTGATLSSTSIKRNISLGLQEYKNLKK